jgi:molybdopterin-containing oxidoreductase family membrane subunit
LIIPVNLSHQRSPFDWGEFNLTPTDIMIPVGTLCLFIFLYMVMSRLIPLIPVWEVQEGQMAHSLRKVGKAEVTSVSELE